MRRWQSGQLHLTVNQTPSGYEGSNPSRRTIRELIGFLEAKMRDARSASQGFPPIFPNEFRIFGALARTVFSPRRRFDIPCDTNSIFALDKYKKNFVIENIFWYTKSVLNHY